MSGWFDAHNHLQDPRLGDCREAAREMKRVGVDRAVVNATCQDDWNDVHALVAWSMSEQQAPELIPAYGIHPWKATAVKDGWLDDLRDYLAAHPQASLGEIGLDGWVDEPDLETQRLVFRAQLELAAELKKPMTIHCLKTWGPLMEELKACPPTAPFLMHSYCGSIEFARELLEFDAYFSFSGYFLQERKAAQLEVFKQLPRERILVETDAPDMTPPAEIVTHPLEEDHNHPANLPAMGDEFANKLGMTTQELAELSAENARACFQL